MSEVQERESAVPPPLSAAPPQAPVVTSGTEGEADPFLKLHKMSTTAGLGSADYVAINGNAIAAVLLGIASAFVLMGSNLLLLLPLAGLICAILAFVQIGNSNGTQTGRGLATLGLLLSLGLGGYYVSRQVYETRRNQADTDAIVSIIHTLGQEISQQKYEQAYATTDDKLRQRVSEEQFASAFQRYNGSPTLGGITSFDWNHLIEFGDDPVTGDRVASGTVLISFKKIKQRDRQPVSFRKVEGQWEVEDFPELFATPAAPASGKTKSSRSEVAGPPAPGK